jgi:hypothetical protein
MSLNKTLLKSATVDSADPNPLFITNQITKMSTTSLEVSQLLEDWLINKLDDSSPHVKKKVLLIIKHVAKSGNEEFARSIISKTEIIKKNTSKILIFVKFRF